jgi:putative ABC transport system permease protein
LEEERDRRFRNRGYNLSYRDSPGSSEEIRAGIFWAGPAEEGALPQISVEEDFADRLDFTLGDTLAFDVQGVEVAGVITSLRRVHWTSFQPNFFVLFQPGALEMAPKTFIGTVGPCDPGEADTLQTGMARAFPAITALNLREAVERILNLLGTLQSLVSLLAGFALVVGVAMLAVVAQAMARDLERPALLLQVLGEEPRRMERRMAGHFAIFGALSGLCGVLLSQTASFAVCRFLWKMPWTPDWVTALAAGSLAAAAGWVCAVYGALRARRRSPRALLSETQSL